MQLQIFLNARGWCKLKPANMQYRSVTFVFLLTLIFGWIVPGPCHAGGSWKWLVPVGAAAGFVSGLFIGLNVYDDAIDSDRKVWTSAAVGGIAGGAGGWLLSKQWNSQAKSFLRFSIIKPQPIKIYPTSLPDLAALSKGDAPERARIQSHFRLADGTLWNKRYFLEQR